MMGSAAHMHIGEELDWRGMLGCAGGRRSARGASCLTHRRMEISRRGRAQMHGKGKRLEGSPWVLFGSEKIGGVAQVPHRSEKIRVA